MSEKIKDLFRFDFSKQNIIRFLKNSLLVILGSFLIALGTAIFVIPFDLVTGGVSGIGIILNKLIPVEWLTVDVWVTILTWVFFFVGLFFLGKNFALQTLIATIFYPFFLLGLSKMADPNVLNGYFALNGPRYAEQFGQMVLPIASIFGGLFVGAGCAFTFLGGGSSGGADVISFILVKYVFKKTKTSTLFFIVDATIIFGGAFIMKNMVVSLLGIITAFLTAIVIDKIFLGGSQAFVAFIVSDKYEEINDAVIHKLDRTTTIIEATGGYSKQGKQLLMLTFSIREYSTVQSIINTVDKFAFMTISRAHEINGEGWTRPSPSNETPKDNNTEEK